VRKVDRYARCLFLPLGNDGAKSRIATESIAQKVSFRSANLCSLSFELSELYDKRPEQHNVIGGCFAN